jgi:cytoskeletal protein RodZ
MDTLTLVLLVVAILAVGVAVWMFMQKRRSQELREDFGPEYGRTVEEYGDRSQAEKELRERKERIEELNIRPLPPSQRHEFAEAWRGAQARFVDDPPQAIAEADRLVAEVMEARGYPMGEFEQRAADVSVQHPDVVQNYRAAHEIAQRSERGAAGTEDLRQAMVHYRALFEDLLDVRETEQTEVRR